MGSLRNFIPQLSILSAVQVAAEHAPGRALRTTTADVGWHRTMIKFYFGSIARSRRLLRTASRLVRDTEVMEQSV